VADPPLHFAIFPRILVEVRRGGGTDGFPTGNRFWASESKDGVEPSYVRLGVQRAARMHRCAEESSDLGDGRGGRAMILRASPLPRGISCLSTLTTILLVFCRVFRKARRSDLARPTMPPVV
jgi:hypothetical protein